jgi:mRNA-degrading endonuclease toxin of MazEF toxin-antitoxin module
MRRGDLVTVAASSDYGKSRPAVMVQTDAFPASQTYGTAVKMAYNTLMYIVL